MIKQLRHKISSRLTRLDKGDSLVEVMLAMALLGAAALSVMGVMTYSQATLQGSLDRTRTQALMESQLDLVRYARDQYVLGIESPNPGRDLWDDLASRIHTSTPNGTVCEDSQNSGWGGDQFYISRSGGGFTATNMSADQRESDLAPRPSDGMWLEIGASADGYLEVAAKSCWLGLGNRPNNEAKIIIKLVDPR